MGERRGEGAAVLNNKDFFGFFFFKLAQMISPFSVGQMFLTFLLLKEQKDADYAFEI